jgi:uncharacterized membrane protein
MKKLLAGLSMLMFFAVAGCSEGTPGGPGVKSAPPAGQGANTGSATSERTVNKPIFGQADNTFKLDVPVMSTTIKQGETKQITIDIARGKAFDEDVTLKFSDLPKGVSVEPAAAMIKNGDKQVKVTIKAAADATLGDFKVKLAGQAAKGPAATNDVKIKIAKK